jgi:hypothetical protein
MLRLLKSVLKSDTALVALLLTVFVCGSAGVSDAVPTVAVENGTPPALPAKAFEHDSVRAASDVPPAAAPASELPPARDCDSQATLVDGTDAAAGPACPSLESDSLGADRAYLIETATPGYTMTRQGPELAIGRLHPEFVHRLAAAIHEARQAGLSSAGIFSAYRPPAFGIGGFSDKFNSLHTYGLAVDMTGIGAPGSADAKTWYEIAARHDVVCPYGVDNRAEWNHCQPTRIKIIHAENPLRETVSADGPVDLAGMFEAGTALINSTDSEGDAGAENLLERNGAERHIHDAVARRLNELSAEIEVPHGLVANHLAVWCRHSHHADKAACGASHGTETAARKQAARSRQAALKPARESRKL